MVSPFYVKCYYGDSNLITAALRIYSKVLQLIISVQFEVLYFLMAPACFAVLMAASCEVLFGYKSDKYDC